MVITEGEGRGGEIAVEWRKLLNEKLCGSYSSNIIRMIKSKRKQWAGRMACRGKNKNA